MGKVGIAKQKNTQKLGKFAQLKMDRHRKFESGMATSLVLNAPSGVELVDPSAIKERQKQTDGTATYFNGSAGFYTGKR